MAASSEEFNFETARLDFKVNRIFVCFFLSVKSGYSAVDGILPSESVLPSPFMCV